jgi:benzoyl-CoA reductase subunit B
MSFGAGSEIVGRANRDGARLFREWFDGLSAAAAEERGAAYVFVMGSLGELLRVFDLPLVFPEINSLQTAVRHVAHDYLNQAEDYGYSPDICGYVKADVATQLRRGTCRWAGSRSRRSRCTPTPATPTSNGPRSGSACTAARP